MVKKLKFIMTKVLIYTRVSKIEQKPENQIIELREFCKKHGWKIFQVLVEKKSGLKGRNERYEFEKIFQLAAERKYDILLVWSLDRFTREGTVKTINYLQELNNYGVAFRSFKERHLDTTGPYKEIIIALLSTIANMESIRRSERIKSGLERKRAQGALLGRKPIQNSKQAEIIKLMQKGLSIRQTAKELGLSKNTVDKYYRIYQNEVK